MKKAPPLLMSNLALSRSAGIEPLGYPRYIVWATFCAESLAAETNAGRGLATHLPRPFIVPAFTLATRKPRPSNTKDHSFGGCADAFVPLILEELLQARDRSKCVI